MKRKCAWILAFAMLLGSAPQRAAKAAEKNYALSYTMYENTFDNGRDSLVAASEEGYMVDNEFLIYDGVLAGMSDIQTAKYIPDGETEYNTAIKTKPGDWTSGKTFLFDFTKNGAKSGIRSGRVTVSYDFELEETSTANSARLGMNMGGEASDTSNNGGRLLYINRTTDAEGKNVFKYLAGAYVGAWPSESLSGVISTEGQHHMEIAMDFDENKIVYYIDGEALKSGDNIITQDLTGMVMNNFMVTISGIYKWFDNLRVVHSFEYPLECIIDSDLSEDHPGNVFFGREDAVVNLNVINRDKDNAYSDIPVTVTVKNGAGETVETHNVSVSVGAFGEANTALRLRLSKYDAYTLTVASGKSAESTARASRCVKVSGNNPKTGVHMQINGAKDKNVENVFYFLDNAGLGNVRTDLGWSVTENSDGTISHSVSGEEYVNRAVEASKKTGVEILGLLSHSSMSSVYPGDEDGGFNTTEAYLQGYYDYCRSVAEKYGDTIKAWEIGNECNYIRRYKRASDGSFVYDGAGNHVTEHDLGENYAPMLLKGYQGIKSVHPESTVLNCGIGTFYENEGNNMVQFANGWLSVAEEDTNNTYFDAFADHTYHTGTAPEIADRWYYNSKYPSGSTFEQAEKYMKEDILGAHGFGDKDSWMTETGFYVGTIYGDVRTEEIAAAYNIRTLLQNEMHGIHKKIFIYNLINEGFDLNYSEHNFGMLCKWENKEWEERSAYAAKPQYLAMAQWNKMMNGAEYITVDRAYTAGSFNSNNQIVVTPYDRYNAKFKNGENIIHVVWDVFDNSEPVTIENSEDKKYTIVYDMNGNITDVCMNCDSYTYDAGKTPSYIVFTDTYDEETEEPEVMFYRDYEDYTGGNNGGTKDGTDEPFNRTGKYGTFRKSGDSSFKNTTSAVDTVNGKAVKLDIFTAWNSGASQINDGAGSLTDIYDGKLYIAYDEIPETGEKAEEIYFTAGGGDYAWCWFPGVKWSAINRNWYEDYTKTEQMQGAGISYKVELVIEPDTGNVYRYINGNPIGTLKIKNSGLEELYFRWSSGNIIDNLTIVYYPENAAPQTFSMTAGMIDTESNTISVYLKSDTLDSDGANGNEIKAPYGISPERVDTKLFEVDGYTVSEVIKGDKSGEYKIRLAEAVTEDREYTVTYNKNVADILGAYINPDTSSVQVASKYEISEPEVSGKAVSTVYTNTSRDDESFVLIAAAYNSDNSLYDVSFKKIPAKSGECNKKVSVELDCDITGKTVKGFAVSNLSELTPIYKKKG